MGKAF